MKLKDIKKGDCFAYQIEDDKELKGRYLTLCTTDLEDGRLSPDNYYYYV